MSDKNKAGEDVKSGVEIPAEVRELGGAIAEIQQNLEKTLAEAEAEREAYGETSEKTGKRVDELDAKYIEVSNELAEKVKSFQVLADRVEEMETKFNRPGFGAPEDEKPSQGKVFVESDGFRRFSESKDSRSSNVAVEPFYMTPAERQKAVLTSANLQVPTRYLAGVGAGETPLTIRDLLPTTPISEGSVSYFRETGFALDGAGAGTQTHGAAAPTAEGAAKPETQYETEEVTDAVKTIAHYLPVTRQASEDQSQIMGLIDRRLRYGLMRSEESQILSGDGTGANLTGILNTTGVQTYSWSSGPSGVDEQRQDALRRAMTLAMIAGYPPDGIAVHPTDWEAIELAKGSDGHYIWINLALGGEARLFRVPVVVTYTLAASTAIVGSWGLGAEIFDREQANIRMDTINDDFVRNQLTVLAEERIALAVYRPEAFVDVTFDSAPV